MDKYTIACCIDSHCVDVFIAAKSGIDAGPVISVGIASNWLKSASVKILMF